MAAALERQRQAQAVAADAPRSGSTPLPHRRVEVHIGRLGLPGDLTQVPEARGLVIFAHGSGSSRHSPRNRQVAAILNGYRLDTLLFDLLAEEEGDDRARVFDIELLGERLGAALRWAGESEQAGPISIGLFGASTGAAAALAAAARHSGRVSAVVSRGGRPDLAAPWLARVQAPTLLIVGGHDSEVLRLNREAMRAMHCEARLEVVPGASHLFQETGALETVAHLAGLWFVDHLPRRAH